jgi:hypothetical protein
MLGPAIPADDALRVDDLHRLHVLDIDRQWFESPKGIVERLRGRIGFADRAGGGTEFCVELPALAAPGEVRQP